jgi:protein TonB
MNETGAGVPGYDELIFESRNREYGAYILRKRYNAVLSWGIIFSMAIGSVSVIVPFLARSAGDVLPGGGNRFVTFEMESLQPPPEDIFIPAAPPPRAENQQNESLRYVPPEVVDTVVSLTTNMASMDEYMEHSADSGLIVSGSGPGEDLLDGNGVSGSEVALTWVEVMPKFRGGDINSFREWVAKRTYFPQEAIDSKIRGTVYITFIVEKDGTVTNVTVIRGVHPLIDNAALKSISESPKWSPGLQRGQPVRVRYQIPLNFVL